MYIYMNCGVYFSGYRMWNRSSWFKSSIWQSRRLSAGDVSGRRRTLASLLTRWSQARAKHPLMTTPDGKGDTAVQALYGDKLLGCAVTAALMERSGQDTPGSLTKVIGAVVSNRFLARHALQILGSEVDTKEMSEWEIGTLVEATVCAIHKDDPDAVDDLAAFLLDAYEQSPEEDTKSRLLELGGTLSVKRIGGSDHLPVFSATASLDGKVATAQGLSKKAAERDAAAHLLETIATNTNNDFETLLWSSTEHIEYNKWTIFALSGELRIQGESPLEWWISKALNPNKATVRAVMAPRVFPDTIEAVDLWHRRRENHSSAGATFALVVTKGGDYLNIPVVEAPSVNQARKKTSLEVNKLIAQLNDIELQESFLGEGR